jgi:Family of unknown function (DUF5681)
MSKPDDAARRAEMPKRRVALKEEPTTDAQVGYKRPPKHSQFRKGQSGNPSGRPRGTRNRDTVIEEELNRIVTIHQNGRPQKITLFQAAAKQLVNKAATGNLAAFKELREQLRTMETRAASAVPTQQSSEADEQVMKDLIQRIAKLKARQGRDEA